ncbi:MAG TPA: SCP2 sterol-binding domain-containing protein [Actinomycetota bacterium]|nr:SCP2 sterol-binding domain-containing protein [Actinomycetota bacterium]
MTAGTDVFAGLHDQQDLAALVRDLSDEEVNRLVEDAGVEATLDRLFTLMVEAFDPEQAAGQSAATQWEVSAGGETFTYHVIIDAGTCRAGTGPVPSPRITLAQGLSDFIRFMAGQTNAVTAFMTGKMKVTGDVMFGPTLESFFRRS